MRPDMAKVIVERPRFGSRLRGHRKGYHRDRLRCPLDEQPKREKIHASDKQFNEHLSPLRRYLRRQVGRPWNLVYSEMCQHIRFDNLVQKHIKTHLFQYVEIHVEIISGVPCYASSPYGPSRFGSPVLSWSARVPVYYVCPVSGLLKMAPIDSRRPRIIRQKIDHFVAIDHEIVFARFDDAWHWLRWATFPPVVAFKRGTTTIHDSLLNRPVTRVDALRTYGRAAFAAEARLARRDEIRRWCEPLRAPNLVR